MNRTLLGTGSSQTKLLTSFEKATPRQPVAMALPAEAYAQIWDVMRIAYPRVQQPSGLQFGGVSRVDSAAATPRRASYKGPLHRIEPNEHVDSVAAKLCDLITCAPRRIAAFETTGHSPWRAHRVRPASSG